MSKIQHINRIRGLNHTPVQITHIFCYIVDLYQYNFNLIMVNCCYLLKKKHKTLLYFVLPVLAFVLILSNIFFGHLVSDSIYDQDINKYSIYVHLQEEWNSRPGNILFDITNVWDGSPSLDGDISLEDPFDISSLQVYNTNQLQHQHGKAYVELKHEFSDCESSWKPVLYRYAVDAARNKIALMQGTQLYDDPYISIFPTIKHKDPITTTSSSYAQFIPICTMHEDDDDDTSYEYSISINDPNSWFDVYFVPSSNQLDNYLNSENFYYYPQDGCHVTGHQSFHGVCENVEQNSGLLVVIPDILKQSLTKVKINLHETR